MDPSIVAAIRSDAETRLLLEEEFEQLERDRPILREIMACRGAGLEDDNSTYLPCNIERIIWNGTLFNQCSISYRLYYYLLIIFIIIMVFTFSAKAIQNQSSRTIKSSST